MKNNSLTFIHCALIFNVMIVLFNITVLFASLLSSGLTSTSIISIICLPINIICTALLINLKEDI